MSDPRLERWLRPRVVFGVLAIVLLGAIVFSRSQFDVGAGTHSTYSRFMAGGRGLYEMMDGLGWRVSRLETPWRAPLDSQAILVVLEPELQPSGTESHELLAAIRRGARVLVVPPEDGPLADSLRVGQSREQASPLVVAPDSSVALPSSGGPRPVERAAREACCFSRYLRPVRGSGTDTTARFPSDTETLVKVRNGVQTEPVVMARRVGAGVILLLADGSMLQNATLRRDDAAVLAVRLFEWLDPGRQRPIVFDEWHQGMGDHPSMGGTISDALVHTAAGRMALQAGLAGLLILLAIGVRPIAPVPRATIERRSPLEHVGALSRAYEAVGATQLATRRLVRGLRRRRPAGIAAALDDDGYLELLASRTPPLSGDVELLRAALRRPLPPAEWVRVGGALTTIERTLAQ